MDEVAVYVAPLMGPEEEYDRIIRDISGLDESQSDFLFGCWFNLPKDDLNLPSLEEGDWVYRYLDNGAGGVGGGVCESRFKELKSAVELMMSVNYNSGLGGTNARASDH